MTAPKSRGTKSKRDKKRLHILLKGPNLVKCKKCGKSIRSHTVCNFCGYNKLAIWWLYGYNVLMLKKFLKQLFCLHSKLWKY